MPAWRSRRRRGACSGHMPPPSLPACCSTVLKCHRLTSQNENQLSSRPETGAPPRHKVGTCPPCPGAGALGAGRTSTAWPSQLRKLCSHHSARRQCGAFHAATTATSGPAAGQVSCACGAAPSRTVSATRWRTAHTARLRLLASPTRDARLQKVVGVAAGAIGSMRRQCMHESECQACFSITNSMSRPRHLVRTGEGPPAGLAAATLSQPPDLRLIRTAGSPAAPNDPTPQAQCGGCTALPPTK